MAGDWIPMRCDLRDDPAVIGIASALGLPEDHVVGLLHNVWSWGSRQTADGNIPSVTFALLDLRIGVAGFAEAMEAHGWLERCGDGLAFPNFDRFNSAPAKTRAKTRLRVRKHRNALPLQKRFKNPPREEKRREEKISPPTPPKGLDDPAIWPGWMRSDGFRNAWDRWQTHRKEIRHALKPTTMKAQLKKLEAMGYDKALAAIGYSIEQGYQGLIEPDAGAGSGQRQSSPARVRAKPGKYADVPLFGEPKGESNGGK